MSPSLSRPCIALLASSVLLHCESKPSPPAPGETQASAQPAGSNPASAKGSHSGPTAKANAPAAEAEVAAEEIPTEEDFEQEAEEQINTTSDLQGELDALEKEIGAAPQAQP